MQNERKSPQKNANERKLKKCIEQVSCFGIFAGGILCQSDQADTLTFLGCVSGEPRATHLWKGVVWWATCA